jgi:hypothetical protein
MINDQGSLVLNGPVECGQEGIAMPCALSRNARTLMVRCLSGEEIKSASGVISACRELERAGLLEKDTA